MLPSPHRLIIALVGPCGAGKSTLASAFANLPGVEVVREVPPEAVNIVGKYSQLDIPAIQVSFLRMLLKQAKTTRANVVVFDRTVEEDRNVFLRLHHELGGLNDREMARLDNLAKRIGKRIGVPAATVILSAEPKVLRQRIANGARPAWLEESFNRQLELYATFVTSIKGAVLEVDTTCRSPDSLLQPLSAWIVETAWSAVAESRMSESREFGVQWVRRSP